MDAYYKESALHALRGNWKTAVLVTLVASILGGAVAGGSFDLTLGIDSEDLQNMPSYVITYLQIVSPIALILGIVQFILGGMIQLGHCRYLLKLYDNEEGRLEDLFSEKDRLLDGLILNLLTGLFTALWSLLFIIPGIIASIRYSMAPFILYENPHLSPMDAINESKEIMDGHKMELFLLDLSFIGWIFLSACTLGIGFLWLSPYQSMAHACFYRERCPKPVYIETSYE